MSASKHQTTLNLIYRRRVYVAPYALMLIIKIVVVPHRFFKGDQTDTNLGSEAINDMILI